MKRTIYSVAVLLLSVAVLFLSVVYSARAEEDSSGWIESRTHVASKTAELIPDQEPLATGFDCTPMNFRVGFLNDGQERHGCAITTAMGTIASGFIVKGEHGTLPLNQNNNPGGSVVPSPSGQPTTVMSAFASASGGYGAQELRVSTYDPSMFVYRELYGWPPIAEYQYTPVAAKTIVDAANKPIPLLPSSIAYSNNSAWMAIARSDGGIMRFDTKTWTGKLIAWDINYTYAETKATNFAISDSGQYIAVNTNIGSPTSLRPSLRVYDVNTCADQSALKAGSSTAKTCEYNDIWNGISQGKTYGDGLKQQLPGAEYPRHIRFVDDNTISFDTIHGRTSSTTYKVASYQVGNGTYTKPTFDLLALGDSYISGEGAFGYRTGTDTAANKCHNSTLSYPYLLGKLLGFDSFNSVACSGAKTEDVASNDPDYLNQLQPKTKQSNLSEKVISDITRDYTPGYINQNQFIVKYKPEKVLLSVGGNDIHFSDIVKLCVLSTGNDSCFDTATERKALLQYIYDQHSVLIDTYTQILDAYHGAKLYVVGYPQIAKVGGNCGLNVHLNADELEFGSLLITRLNQTIKHAAEAAGVRYVDVENALSGSMLCESGTKAVNGLSAGDDALLGMLGNESYHPTAFGHVLLANTISRRTNNLTQVMPVATHASKLAVDDSDSFIAGADGAGGLLRKLIFGTFVERANLLFRTIRFQFDTSTLGISPGAAYVIAFHSQEVKVANGTVPTDGIIDVDITVPELKPGGHTIHLYTQDSTGENLDVMQMVYVPANQTDYDGDGIPNVSDSCPTVANTGLDTDGDGVDDACDGNTAALAVPPTSDTQDSDQKNADARLATEANKTQATLPASGSIVAHSTPVVLAEETTKTEGASSAPKQTPGNDRVWIVVTAGLILLLVGVMYAVFGVRRSE